MTTVEKWVLDPTATQYGWVDIMTRWDNWRDRRSTSPTKSIRHFANFTEMFTKECQKDNFTLFDFYNWWEQGKIGGSIFNVVLTMIEDAERDHGRELKDYFSNGWAGGHNHEKIDTVCEYATNILKTLIEGYYKAAVHEEREKALKQFMMVKGCPSTSTAAMKAYEKQCLEEALARAADFDPALIDLDAKQEKYREQAGDKKCLVAVDTNSLSGVKVITSSTGFHFQDLPGGGSMIMKLPAEGQLSAKEIEAMQNLNLSNGEGSSGTGGRKRGLRRKKTKEEVIAELRQLHPLLAETYMESDRDYAWT